MEVVRWDPADEAVTEACFSVSRAADEADDPLGAPQLLSRLRAWFLLAIDPAEVWLVPGEPPGSVLGWYRIVLPALEDLDRARLALVVHPDSRRRGTGTALLRHAAGRAAAHGRLVLGGGALAGSPGELFARHSGARAGLLGARRIQVLAQIPPGRVAALHAEAARAAAGYSLVSWTGRTPCEYLDGLAAVFNALNDAPRDEGEQARAWDARRIREHVDDLTDWYGSRMYTVAARHDATGEMAAVTQVAVDPETPEWGHQEITAVTRPHRGHRLGMLVKTAMLSRLADAEPALQRIVTGNAASNQHMIAINEALGYEFAGPLYQAFELGVADVGA